VTVVTVKPAGTTEKCLGTLGVTKLFGQLYDGRLEMKTKDVRADALSSEVMDSTRWEKVVQSVGRVALDSDFNEAKPAEFVIVRVGLWSGP
jgi:hypothetical protein